MLNNRAAYSSHGAKLQPEGPHAKAHHLAGIFMQAIGRDSVHTVLQDPSGLRSRVVFAVLVMTLYSSCASDIFECDD